MATVESMSKRQDSASSVWASQADPRDSLVWRPLKLVGPTGTPAPPASLPQGSRAANRAAMRVARKAAAVVNTEVRQQELAGRRRVWKGRRMVGMDLTRAQIRRVMKGK